MWEPQLLATVRVSTACTGTTLPFLLIIQNLLALEEKLCEGNRYKKNTEMDVRKEGGVWSNPEEDR
jgi:hypothetical protein